jgi:diguanylate cyclase (GGDEF)-like protein
VGVALKFFDRLTGIADMRLAERRRVWRLQLRAIANMAPAMASGLMASIWLPVYFSYFGGEFGIVATFAAILTSLMGYFVYGKFKVDRLRRLKPIDGVSPTHLNDKQLASKIRIGHIVVAVMGLLWGIYAAHISLLLPEQSVVAATVLVVASLITGTFWFGVVPSMSFLLTAPLVVGSLYNVVFNNVSELNSHSLLSMLLIGFGTIIVGIFYSRRFVLQLSFTIKARENSALANMLLDELQAEATNWVWETGSNGSLDRFPRELIPELSHANDFTFETLFEEIVHIKGTQLEKLMDDMRSSETFKDIEICVRPNAMQMWLRVNGHPKFDEEGELTGYVGTIHDLTSEKLAEDRIKTLAQSDTLTGLMNRTAFSDRLAQAVANLERYGRPFTVLHLDLDDFKLVNDTKGHLFGDRLLAEASERIHDEVREGDCLARLSGDEFAVLMDSQGDAGSAARLAARMIGEVSKPYVFDDEEFKVGLSIGIAMAPLNGIRPDQLLRNADLALYRAKADGRGVFRFFENHMDSELRERRMLESELRHAVSNDELVLHFQPLVDANSHKPMGMESLIRWQHPIRGLLSPIEFVELAEQSQLISEIGKWTLEKACTTAMDWPEHMFVAVNLSAHHFMRSDIEEEVAEVLEKTGLTPSRLELEITESLLIHNSDDVIAKINGLKAIGVSVAMDDFGTGYSSLSYLMSVPFDKLKIDKSFVDQVAENESGQSIVKMISSLANELNLKVTAEGVEDLEQAKFLDQVGCDLLQGYYFSRPLSEEKLPAYFMEQVKLGLFKKKSLKLEKAS